MSPSASVSLLPFLLVWLATCEGKKGKAREQVRSVRSGGGLQLSDGEKAFIAGTKKVNRFISMGCWGGEKGSRDRQREVGKLMGRLLEEHNLSYTVAAGDNFYRRGVTSVSDARWIETFEAVYPQGLPFVAALGNHDYKGDIWAQVNYTFTPHNVEKGRWHLPYPYYSKRMGDVELIVIDTVLLERCEVNKKDPKMFAKRCWDRYEQLSWIENTLEKADRDPTVRWKVVVGHYPMYANGPHVNQPWLRRILSPLFERYHVSLYINADNHYMQYAVHNGVYYVNAGGGAGYMPHVPANKGYAEDPESRWVHIGDGVFVHFAGEEEMLVLAYDPHLGLLHKFTVPAASPRASMEQRTQPPPPPLPVHRLPTVSSPSPQALLAPSAFPFLCAAFVMTALYPIRYLISAKIRRCMGGHYHAR